KREKTRFLADLPHPRFHPRSHSERGNEDGLSWRPLCVLCVNPPPPLAASTRRVVGRTGCARAQELSWASIPSFRLAQDPAKRRLDIAAAQVAGDDPPVGTDEE